MSRNRTRLRSIESRVVKDVTHVAVPDPRVGVALPFQIRRWAHQGTGCRVTWDTARRCWMDVATGWPEAELEAELFQKNIRDLDTRWRSAGDFHMALRGWTDEGVDWNAPLYPTCQWKEKGYARFRRRLADERAVSAGTPRPGHDVDWSNDLEGEKVDLEELALLGWKEGLDLDDWRFTHELV